MGALGEKSPGLKCVKILGIGEGEEVRTLYLRSPSEPLVDRKGSISSQIARRKSAPKTQPSPDWGRGRDAKKASTSQVGAEG